LPGEPAATLARQDCPAVNGFRRYESYNLLFMISMLQDILDKSLVR
jgi:hypothetical protein